MILGVVGSEQAKFTPETERLARIAIKEEIQRLGATELCSGGCHLGGVDIYAEEIAEELGLPMIVYAPSVRRWSGPGGYMDRNLKIAKKSNLVLCVTVKELPPAYDGMRFTGCYHCGRRNPPHVKSGGCWTAWKCHSRSWRIVEPSFQLEVQ